MSRYPKHPGYKDHDTGKLAADAFRDKAVPIRKRFLKALTVGPQTSEQVADKIDVHWMIARARASELKAEGLVIETGQHGKGALGGKVKTWRLTTADERAAFLAAKSEGEHV